MENQKSKKDLLKEIVDLSNSDLDFFFDTSKFLNKTRDLKINEKENIINNQKNNNFDESSNKKEEENKNQQPPVILDNINENITSEIKENEDNEPLKKESCNEDNNNLFDEADDILNNFNKNLKLKESRKVFSYINSEFTKSLPIIMKNKLNPIDENKENINDDKKIVHNIININDKKSEENEIKSNNSKNKLKLLSLKSCEFNREENRKALGNIFDMLDTNEINSKIKNDKIITSKELYLQKSQSTNDNKNEINSIREKKEELKDNTNNSSSSLNIEEKKEIITERSSVDTNTNKINNENNDNIISENVKEENKEIIKENNEINSINGNINNVESKIELTGTKIDLVEKMENLFFSKKKDFSELNNYLNNKFYEHKEFLDNKEKILYNIIQSFPKNKLLTLFFHQNITSLYLDTEDFLYCGDEKGNLVIYSIKEEKIVKQLENPFLFEIKNNQNFPCIKVISSDDQFIIAGYDKGKFALFYKNENKPTKTKIYDSFQEISQHNIIEIKIYSKKKNSILIYSCDDQENIFRTKMIKNKIFKNKVYTNRITGCLKNTNKKEPYYYLEINPFWYKCIGVVNNRGVFIYIIKKCKKDVIFKWNNLDENNAYLSFFFAQKKEEKNKFYISNMNKINIYEINDDYNGVVQQKLIILKDNIIKIGLFMNDLIYAFDQKNTIRLINYYHIKNNTNTIKKIEDNEYGFYDKIPVNTNNSNDIVKDKEQENYQFLLNYYNFLSVKNGAIFMYSKNNILSINSFSLYEGITKIYNSIFDNQNIEKWDILFNIGKEIYQNKHPIWKIDKINKFQDIYINYTQSFLSLLIINFLNNEEKKDEINKIIKKFNVLISFLFDIELYNFIIGEKKLSTAFHNSKLDDLYYYLLEPYIIEDRFMNLSNLPISFINNLMDCYLYKNNKESKFIKMNKSWISELLTHFDIKKYFEKEKGLLENMKDNYLINTIIYFVLNYSYNEIMINNSIDYSTALTLLIRLLKSKIKNYQKNTNKEENEIIDLNNEELFKSENRYKDEIIFSIEYLRIKILWYIYKILKIKILIDNPERTDDLKKSLFIKEIIKIPLDEELFNNIVFASYNNDDKDINKKTFLDKEFIYIITIMFENEILSKFSNINKEEILQKLINLFTNRKESQIYLNLLLVKSIINDKELDISNQIKLNTVLFFLENNCLDSDIYPEIKEINFQENLIEILKLIDSYSFDDSEKLIKLAKKCENSYNKLYTYIKNTFKN